MIQLTPEYKQQVLTALLEQRQNFDGTDEKFANQYGLNPSVYSQLKNGKSNAGLVRDAVWLEIGQRLDVALNKRKWVTVETDVYRQIHDSVVFCQMNAKSLMLVDDTGIGKSYTAKHLSRTLKNCFYIDVSQAKSKIEFIRLFARTIGVNEHDRIAKVKAAIKYVLKILPNPVVIIDEAGDAEDKVFLEIKEIWNATEGNCGWYMMGAEGLQEKVERNIHNRKPGFAETFSRFGERYNHIVPIDKTEKQSFYRKLITDVLDANMKDKTELKRIVNKCLTNDSGKISGLRRAESLLLIHAN